MGKAKIRFFRARLRAERRRYWILSIVMFTFLALVLSVSVLWFLTSSQNMPRTIAAKQIELKSIYDGTIYQSREDLKEEAKCAAKDEADSAACEKTLKNELKKWDAQYLRYLELENQLAAEGYKFGVGNGSFAYSFDKEGGAYLKSEADNQRISDWLKLILGPILLFSTAWLNKVFFGQYIRYNDLLLVVEFFSDDAELAKSIAENETFTDSLLYLSGTK